MVVQGLRVVPVQSEEEEEKEEYMLAILPQHSKLNVPLLSKSTMKHIYICSWTLNLLRLGLLIWLVNQRHDKIQFDLLEFKEINSRRFKNASKF